MVKNTQTIRRQQPTNCVSAFDHFVGLALKWLKYQKTNSFSSDWPFNDEFKIMRSLLAPADAKTSARKKLYLKSAFKIRNSEIFSPAVQKTPKQQKFKFSVVSFISVKRSEAIGQVDLFSGVVQKGP